MAKNQRSMAVTLLMVCGITVLAVLGSTGLQLLIFGKNLAAVSTAVGVVTGMGAARQLTRKPAE
jgi:hypothetical protein